MPKNQYAWSSLRYFKYAKTNRLNKILSNEKIGLNNFKTFNQFAKRKTSKIKLVSLLKN